MRRLLPLTLAAVLACAGIAHAQSVVIPTRSTTIPAPWTAKGWSIAPKLMGEEVAWLDGGTRFGTVRAWAADPQTRRLRRLATLSDDFAGLFDGQPRFDASATRIGISAPMHQGGFLTAGSPTDLRPLDREWWEIEGDRLLFSGDEPRALFLLDPVSGERFDFTLPDFPPEPPPSPVVRSVKLAGDLLAFHQNREGGVMEWRTRRVLTRFRTEDFGHVAGVQPDGTVVWGEGEPWSTGRGPFHVQTPEGEQRPLPLPASIVPILAGDRVAYHDRARGVIAVADLTGREIASVTLTPDATGSDLVRDFGVDPDGRPVLSDFDGRRVTWSYQPCAVALVAVWDVDAGAMEQPRPRCRSARLAGVVREEADGHRVPLWCIAPRVIGCATRLTLRERGGRVLHTMRVDLPAGARRGVLVQGLATEKRRLVVMTEPALRAEPGQRRSWAVRVR